MKQLSPISLHVH